MMMMMIHNNDEEDNDDDDDDDDYDDDDDDNNDFYTKSLRRMTSYNLYLTVSKRPEIWCSRRITSYLGKTVP